MRRLIFVIALATLVSLTVGAAGTAQAQSAAQAEEPLPISRIFLYKNGMAYIVRAGEISEPLPLSFHPDDMNDVLKTFTAWNPSDGSLYALGYTTGIPAQQILGRYPFELRDPGMGLAGFLEQVKGAEVRVSSAALNDATGKLLAVNLGQRAVGDTVVDDFQISILKDSGEIVTDWLSNVRSLRMAEDSLQRQLAGYLEILAEGAQDVTKQITVYPGQGGGPVRASYLQQFPVWKTSYRLQFQDDPKQGVIEGWAHIDNPTGEEWHDVELTLISGMPVSFIMDLYQPLYADRSRVPVPGAEVAAPRFYQSALSKRAEADQQAMDSAEEARRAGARTQRLAQLATGIQAESVAEPSAAPMEFEAGASGEFTQAEGRQVQDYFEYSFPFPVDLGGRQSAFLPFLRREVKAQRLSIYNAVQDQDHPRSGLRLQNDSGVPLEAGPVTFFEQGRYAGEAVLEYMPRDDERLLSYGVDLEVQAGKDFDRKGERIAGLKVANGIAELFVERVQTHRYSFRNKSRRAKLVVLEHPRRADIVLRDIEPDETTQGFYRFNIDLSEGQEREFPVTEILSRKRTLALFNASRDSIRVFFSGYEVPAGLRRQLEEIFTLRDRIAEKERELNGLRNEISNLSQDQERRRENLKALGRSDEEKDLRERLARELGEGEERFSQLRQQERVLQEEITGLNQELAQKVRSIDFDDR
ncbi:MAG TPA: hypothetical protein VLV83_05800 [Acidobacteriota bacterium]|nr:hypothetical protein [Acidobacteriota bacterium]